MQATRWKTNSQRSIMSQYRSYVPMRTISLLRLQPWRGRWKGYLIRSQPRHAPKLLTDTRWLCACGFEVVSKRKIYSSDEKRSQRVHEASFAYQTGIQLAESKSSKLRGFHGTLNLLFNGQLSRRLTWRFHELPCIINKEEPNYKSNSGGA